MRDLQELEKNGAAGSAEGYDAGFSLELHSQSVNRRDVNGVYRFQVIGRAYVDMMVYAVQELHMAIEGRYCRVEYVATSEKFAANKIFMTAH